MNLKLIEKVLNMVHETKSCEVKAERKIPKTRCTKLNRANLKLSEKVLNMVSEIKPREFKADRKSTQHDARN